MRDLSQLDEKNQIGIGVPISSRILVLSQKVGAVVGFKINCIYLRNKSKVIYLGSFLDVV
jgi:hypothetical protein